MTIIYSLTVGTAVGVCYALIGLRSPAPPVVALIGLLGMLAGEMATMRVLQVYQSGSQGDPLGPRPPG